MTTALDTKLVPVARNLITSFGQTVSWSQVLGSDSPAGDIIEGIGSASEQTTISLKMSPPIPYGRGMETNTNQLKQETVMYAFPAAFVNPVDSSVFTPEPGGIVTLIDTTTLVCTEVNPMFSGDQIAAYELVFRG